MATTPAVLGCATRRRRFESRRLRDASATTPAVLGCATRRRRFESRWLRDASATTPAVLGCATKRLAWAWVLHEQVRALAWKPCHASSSDVRDVTQCLITMIIIPPLGSVTGQLCQRMVGFCKQCCSGKQIHSRYKCSAYHHHCSKACMDRNGCVKSIETKAKQVS